MLRINDLLNGAKRGAVAGGGPADKLALSTIMQPVDSDEIDDDVEMEEVDAATTSDSDSAGYAHGMEAHSPPVDWQRTRKRMDMSSIIDCTPVKRMDSSTGVMAPVKRPEMSLRRIIDEMQTPPQTMRPVPRKAPTTTTPRTTTTAPLGFVPRIMPVAGLEDRGNRQMGGHVQAPMPKTQSTAKQEVSPPRRRGRQVLTEDEKRIKQRMLVKRSYYRKINTINELREVVKNLEQDYQSAIANSRSQSSNNSSLSEEDELRERYTQLSISKTQLLKENEELRHLTMEQSKVRIRLGIAMDEEAQDRERELAKALPIDGEQRLSPSIHLVRPVVESDCVEVVRAAVDKITAFYSSENYESTGASIFGWRDRRRIEGNLLKFSLYKTFKNRTVEDLSRKTWEVLSDERGINRIYSSSIHVRFHLVQRVNDDNVVMYRTIEPDGQNVVIKTVILASRVQTERGMLVLFRSLDPTKWKVIDVDAEFPSSKAEMWTEMFCWGLFEAVGEEGQHCRDSFGGFVPATAATGVQFWMMEVLLIACRCENEVVGPLFILE
ncbi:TPA: hypothetical protein N0F65_007288 [Lagenidium giganteum]|uniref:Uncharacterized protein n=1 Tax=Lagenidium giganteum TaxID=4803 RepID=A0AAV2Z218_9STRA|nr:TPA: hypothetical protein N0F65_007288 [Lagenidium giganteum]